MNQIPSDKCNLAWFKLAEFVARREKERALGIYRLLMHSLPDEAIRAQLEGDLLLAFNDVKALNCYEKAAFFYESTQQHTEAIAIYEHCITIISDCVWMNRVLACELHEKVAGKYHKNLVRAFVHAGKPLNALRVIERSAKALIDTNDRRAALEFVHAMVRDYATHHALFIVFYEQLFFTVFEDWSSSLSQFPLPDYLKEHITIFVKEYLSINSGHQLNSFLSRLAVLYEPAQEYALKIMQTLC